MPTRSTLTASSRASSRPSGDTKTRLLDAAEALFIDAGYEAMSMRLITARADANLAAVNYHFGGKDALIHAMLTRRLDGLNQNRLALLERFQSSLGSQLTCEHILGAMFIPALEQSRCIEKSGPALLRLLGRAYTDPSPFIRDFLRGIYADVAEDSSARFKLSCRICLAKNLAGGCTFASALLAAFLPGLRQVA